MLMKPGRTIVISENVLESVNFATTSSAIINGAFLYSFAAANAPLH